LALGDAGARVYVTGRTVRGGPKPRDNAPGTVDDTADEVTRRGGSGIAVRCDHTNDAEVRQLFDRIDCEAGRLDLLVNAAWGGNDPPISMAPFWELSTEHWPAMFDAGVRAAVVASQHAAARMVKQRHGLIVNVTAWDDDKYTRHFLYDLAKAALNRAAATMAEELKQEQVAAVALAPGWMRTERVLAHFGADEASWTRCPELSATESPLYLGRAVVALAGDGSGALGRSGRVVRVADLATEYSFTDLDGRQPPPFKL